MLSNNLGPSSVSVPLNTRKTKFEEIPLKDIEGDTFQVKTTPLRQIFPERLAKILLGIDQYLMLSQHSNKALVEDGGFAQNKYR